MSVRVLRQLPSRTAGPDTNASIIGSAGFTVAKTSLADLILADNPLGFWRCNDNTQDALTSGQPGAPRSAPIVGTVSSVQQSGPPGLASTDAIQWSGAYATMASPGWFQGGATFKTWTIEAYVKTTANQGCIVSRDDADVATTNAARMCVLFTDANGFLNWYVFHTDGSDSHVVGSTTIHDGNWHQVIATYDQGTTEIFLDKVSQGTMTNAGKTPNNGGARPLKIAAWKGSASETFYTWGQYMTHVAIYDQVLPAARRDAHYAAAFS